MTSPHLGWRRRTRALAATLALASAVAFSTAGCAAQTDAPDVAEQSSAAVPARPKVNDKHVIAISLDGFTPLALTKLGRAKTPYLHKLILEQGAGTTNARTQVEMTVTLPNHTSMVTGRRITASAGGHGVTWNTDTVRKTVQQAAGHDVGSVFQQVHRAGGKTAVFSTKSKFALFDRSWPASVDKSVIKVENDAAVTKAMRADLITARRSFYFLHLGLTDQIGHAYGWMSPKYLRAVMRLDALVGSVMRRVRLDPKLNRSTIIILTADHGGAAGHKEHGNVADWRNFRIPFAFWGAGVPNVPLYDLNPSRGWPNSTQQPGFTAARQPIRNGEVANASLSILGVPAVPGSLWDSKQDLTWHR